MEQTNPAQTIAPPTPPGYQHRPGVEQMTQAETKATKTLYDTSYGNVILKNFLAGAMRAFGAVFIYAIFIFLMAQIFSQYVLPEIRPLLNSFEKLSELQTKASIIVPDGAAQTTENFNQ